ncbi:TonB-dependent receptor [Mucinivorans hirudinis]|uniref:TonB-dependent receptor n=1 Tax=Mucinivorans hirudinis TaxID=1433126 RepID=A0A060R7Q0_9BACT|nr:TonB-dependent receptor [Mucinivorans hirudinis]
MATFFRGLLFLFVFYGTLITNAQECERQRNLQEVVVTGTRTAKRLSEAPVLTTVVRARDMVKAGTVSTLEALEDNIPGLVSEPNVMGNNLRIKGLNSRYILFLVDGERMVSEGAGGNVNLNQIDVGNIERIEVINGAASALYGSNAVGAVINIITKEPSRKFEGGANLQYESHNTIRAKVDAGTNLGKFKSRIDIFRHSSDGFGADGKGAYAAKYEDFGGNLKLGYTPTQRVDMKLTGRYFRHETFNTAGSLNSAHPLTHTVSAGFNGTYSSADSRYTVCGSVHFDKYFDADYLEKLAVDNLKGTATYISSRILNTFRPSHRWEIVAGIEQNREQNYATKTLGATPTTKNIDDSNLFGQAQWTPSKDFDVILGARYTYNSQFRSAFTPKVSAMYRLGGFTFRGGVGSAFRAPSIKELYYDFDHQGMFWIYGNPNLKAEMGLYNSLSAEYTRCGFNVSLSGYWNNIDNKITQYDLINSSGGNEKHYRNVSSATLVGVDVNLQYALLREVIIKGSYSYCDARDNSTGRQLSDNVRHSGTMSATWNGNIARSPFSLQLAGRMNSPKLYRLITATGSDRLLESKPYNIWKVVFVKPFRIDKHALELTLKLDNIFDFKDASFINPGRQYLVGVRYSFK